MGWGFRLVFRDDIVSFFAVDPIEHGPNLPLFVGNTVSDHLFFARFEIDKVLDMILIDSFDTPFEVVEVDISARLIFIPVFRLAVTS